MLWCGVSGPAAARPGSPVIRQFCENLDKSNCFEKYMLVYLLLSLSSKDFMNPDTFILSAWMFDSYLPRGTLIDGSQKCRMGAFCTIAKNSGEMLKKRLKNRPKWCQNFFFGPQACWIITFVTFFYFQYFSFWCFKDPLLFNNFVEISPKNRVL